MGDAEQVQRGAGAHDVDDGVEAADFVEFDFVEADAVHLGFCFAEGAEHAQSVRLHVVWNVGVGDEGNDVAIWAMRCVVVM